MQLGLNSVMTIFCPNQTRCIIFIDTILLFKKSQKSNILHFRTFKNFVMKRGMMYYMSAMFYQVQGISATDVYCGIALLEVC